MRFCKRCGLEDDLDRTTCSKCGMPTLSAAEVEQIARRDISNAFQKFAEMAKTAQMGDLLVAVTHQYVAMVIAHFSSLSEEHKLPAMLSFLTSFGREVIKGVRDMEDFTAGNPTTFQFNAEVKN